MAFHMRTRLGSQGLTLIEVLTAASLMGVISVIAATNFRAYVPGFRARGAALEIAGDMNTARLRAVKESRRYTFTPLSGTRYEIQFVDANGNDVLVKRVDVARDFPGVHFGATGITIDPYGNDIGPAVPAAAVVFNTDGTINNAASVYVEPTTEQTHNQHGVAVTGAGRIRVWHWNGTAWD